MAAITVTTRIDRDTYKTFTRFNTYTAFHHWVGLLLFPVFMIFFALVNLHTGSRILFGIFLAAALFSLLWNITLYPLTQRHQISKLGLDGTKTAYTVHLDKKGIHISNDKEAAAYDWNKVYVAYRTEQCIYLYMTKTRCFILPAKDIQDGKTIDTVWELLTNCLQKYQMKVVRTMR